ncbi:hypothetical protein SEA_DARDANUS_56 [Gordonia phage Dardanus]|uniref:Uncharacterized protein n=1 Tax=Gordonia phage Dardanus TaxID=2588489 RepID=A0A514CX53_9CAUD|nr:hypothetical protein KDJ58_gp56 [Gordonia phage Dardanus]QDH85093.1 hypothetical protein SEA_DARDANUS_56 [Gordonia phage Dardanus]
MPKYHGDPDRVVIAESFDDGRAYMAGHPEVAGWSVVSVPTLDYRMKGRHLQDYRLTPRVAARREAPLIEQACEFLVAIYGVSDDRGDVAAHYETLARLVRPAPKGDG